MKRIPNLLKLATFLFSVLLVFSFAVSSQQKIADSIQPSPLADKRKTSVTSFKLPIPNDEGQRNYLGLSKDGKFKLPETSTDVLLINIFSMYCPTCQKEAPKLNGLYETIEQEPKIKGRIKIIGIGLKNSDFDVRLFRDKFKVPFPLFADKNYSICEKLGVEQTPTLIGVRFLKEEKPIVFLYSLGRIGEISVFLERIIDMSHLK